MFTSPAAIAFETPYFTIYWYGVILALAFLVGQLLAVRIAKNEYNSSVMVDNLYEAAFWTLLGGILGARLYYVLLSLNYYISHVDEIFMLQQGGLSIHGAIIGGILGGIIFCQIKKINFFQYADIYAFALPVAQAIGRWGNFFNSEAFGLPTTLPWAVYIPLKNRPIGYEFYDFFHPTFLYESIWNIFTFLILYFVLKKYFFKRHGILFFSYLILYSIGRILIEFIRLDSVLKIMGISIAVWACLITIIIAVLFIYFLFKKQNTEK